MLKRRATISVSNKSRVQLGRCAARVTDEYRRATMIAEIHSTIPSGLNLMADVAFGRDIARFHQLVEFLAILSIVLWMMVVLTALLRTGIRFLLYPQNRQSKKPGQA